MGAGCQRDVVTQTGSISVLVSCALVGGKQTCRCPMDIKDKIAYRLTKYNMYRADPSQVADHRNG